MNNVDPYLVDEKFLDENHKKLIEKSNEENNKFNKKLNLLFQHVSNNF